MSKSWSRPGSRGPGYRWFPERAVCALCHRNPGVAVASLTTSRGLAAEQLPTGASSMQFARGAVSVSPDLDLDRHVPGYYVSRMVAHAVRDMLNPSPYDQEGVRQHVERAYQNIPICRPCALKYRIHQTISRAAGALFLLGAVASFVVAVTAPGGGLLWLLVYPPMQVALIATVGFGLFGAAHYAFALLPYNRRVEEWLLNPRLRGEY